MKVANKTSFSITAFGWHELKGYGDDIHIPPGETAEVNGPYLGEMGGGSCHVALDGEVVCQETSNDAHGFLVAQGHPIRLANGDHGITIRHHADAAEDFVTAWRRSNPRQKEKKRDIGRIVEHSGTGGLGTFETH